MVAPLMPKATAVWLVENTALSFDQVADFCKLHPLEVKAIADGDSAQGIKGRPGYHPPDVAKCFLAAAEGKVRAQIERVLPLSRAPEAHRLIESGEATGKLVLDPTQG